jgi:hypothetical protein
VSQAHAQQLAELPACSLMIGDARQRQVQNFSSEIFLQNRNDKVLKWGLDNQGQG